MREAMMENTVLQLADRLLKHLQKNGSPTSHHLPDCLQCKARWLPRLRAVVQAGHSLELVLPAFPAKSANPRKTLSSRPDLGEVLALSRLQALCASLQAIYSEPVRLVIASDGRVFNDLVLVDEADVRTYLEGLRELMAIHDWHALQLVTLDDFFPDAAPAGMQTLLMDRFGEPLHALKERVAQDPAARTKVDGIHRFIVEDRMALLPDLSKNRIRKDARLVAWEVVRRSNAWSRLLERYYPEAIRLSIHPQPCGSNKLAIRLLESRDIWATPWHNVVLRDAGGWRLVHREEAERLGATCRDDHFVLEAQA